MNEITKFLSIITIGISFTSYVYHFSLYLNLKERVYFSYSFYLLSLIILGSCSYYFSFFPKYSNHTTYKIWGHGFQILSFIFLAIFIRTCLTRYANFKPKQIIITDIGIGILITYFIVFFIPCFIWGESYFLYNYNADIFLVARIVLFSLIVFFWFNLFLRRQNILNNNLAKGILINILLMFLAFITQATKTNILGLQGLPFVLLGSLINISFISLSLSWYQKKINNDLKESLNEKIRLQNQIQEEKIKALELANAEKNSERARIARDLHDDMGSMLSSISMYGQVAESYVKTNSDKALEIISKIIATSQKVMENTSDLIWSLQSNYDNAEPLFERMKKHCNECFDETHIPYSIHLPQSHALSGLSIIQQKHLWLIFKEATNNIRKYSKATDVYISLSQQNDTIELFIKDNGIGFDINQTHGNGLKNMQYRADVIGGQLKITSKYGETIIHLILPIRNQTN